MQFLAATAVLGKESFKVLKRLGSARVRLFLKRNVAWTQTGVFMSFRTEVGRKKNNAMAFPCRTGTVLDVRKRRKPEGKARTRDALPVSSQLS
jgi:hypothetical protein